LNIVARQRRLLNEKGIPLPHGGTELLDAVFASLCEGPLLSEWGAVGLAETETQQVNQLLEILSRARADLPRHEDIDAAILHLRESARQ